MAKNKYTWKMIFNDFREIYPELWAYGTVYQPYGYMSIMIFIPLKGKVIYNAEEHTLIWIERWTNDKEFIDHKNDERVGLYREFRSEIENYQKETGATVRDIAEMSGVSKNSIIDYIIGESIPKISTMRKIADSLGIELDY